MTLFVGTSGWAYKEWKPDFYPADLPQNRFLQHYSSELSACEINATFYRLQSEETFAKWANATAADFRFSLKAHRGLTHSKKLAPADDNAGLLTRFLESFGALSGKLGVVLFQLPPYRHRDDEALVRLLEVLPPGHRYAFEFRHESWVDEKVTDLIAMNGATICLSETEGRVPERLPPGPLAYIRMRADRYTPEARDAWRDLLGKEAVERDVFAFAKHEGIPTDDPYGGIGLARWLVNELGTPPMPLA